MKLIILISLSFLFALKAIAQKTVLIKGKVINYDTKEIFEKVTIKNITTNLTYLSSDSGTFSIPVNINEYTISFSYVGFFTKTITIIASGNINLIIELKKKPTKELEEITVVGRNSRNKAKENEIGLVKLNVEKLKQQPTAFGEADILKAIAQQPGVTVAGEGAGGINVRGGAADQNLVLLDEAPLFNTSHLLGFYTTVSPDVLQNVNLYKGSIPANYGGRIASLLQINTKKNVKDDLQYSGGLSVMSGRMFINGALKKNKIGITVGTRIAFPNLILSSFPNNFKDKRAFFYDGLLKFVFKGKDSSFFTITSYRSFDEFGFDALTSYKWNSNVLALNYTKPINKKWSLTSAATYSDFTSILYGREKNYESKLTSSISQNELKAALQVTVFKNSKLSFGANAILYNILPSKQAPNCNISQINDINIAKEKAIEMASFINADIELTPALTITTGLRFAKFNYLGNKTVYKYIEGMPMSPSTIVDSTAFAKNKTIKMYSGFEPRLALKYLFAKNTSIKIGYHKAQQFLHLISNNIAISPVDFWKLSDTYLPQQIGDQYSVGLYKSGNKMQYSIEAYYKEVKNTIEYKNGASLFLNKYIESALLPAKLYSYGVEINATKVIGKFTGEINYSYTKSYTKVLHQYAIDRVNEGNWFSSNQDRPHNININTKLKLDAGWAFHANFVFVTGRPTTFPDGTYLIGNSVVTNFSYRNADRLPNYHRLDVGFSCVTKRFSTQKKYSVWNFSFYNLYARQNAYSIFFKREGNALNAYRLSVIGTIIPSLSWNYYF